jgi:hypothetical protein
VAGNDRAGSGEARPARQVRLPVIGFQIQVPEPQRIAWYAGLGLMAAFELIDWELALVIGIGHLIADNVRSPTVANLAEGVESGA